MMRRFLPSLIPSCALAALVSSPVSAGQPAGAAADSDFQKLEELTRFLRNRNAEDYAVSVPRGIDEGRYVEIGGIEQWITIRGEDRSNPVLLFPAAGGR